MISRICRGIRRLQDCVGWKGFDVAAKLRRRAEMFERLKCSWHGGEFLEVSYLLFLVLCAYYTLRAEYSYIGVKWNAAYP
jgi:hypothetical protein